MALLASELYSVLRSGLMVESLKEGKRSRAQVLSLFFEIKEVMVNFGVDSDRIEYGGSLRRGKVVVGDLDIAVFDESLDRNFYANVITSLQELGHVIEHKTLGDFQTAFSVDGFLVEIKKAPIDSYATMMIFITGSGEFNIGMRAYAKSKGYKLNQYGLTDPEGNVVKTPREEDVFKALGVLYVSPENRSVWRGTQEQEDEFRGLIPTEVYNSLPLEVRDRLKSFKLPTKDEKGIVIPDDFLYNPTSRHNYYRVGGQFRIPEEFKLEKYL